MIYIVRLEGWEELHTGIICPLGVVRVGSQTATPFLGLHEERVISKEHDIAIISKEHDIATIPTACTSTLGCIAILVDIIVCHTSFPSPGLVQTLALVLRNL